MSITLRDLHFDETAPPGVIGALVEAATSGRRVHINYGDPVTGRVSLDTSASCYGYVGRSPGEAPFPLLAPTRRSKSGYQLEERNIVRIRDARSGRVLWRHPTYSQDSIQIVPCEPVVKSDVVVLTVQVNRAGQMYRQFENVVQARHYCNRHGLDWTEEWGVFPLVKPRKVTRRSARPLVKAVRAGNFDCDSALEEHLHDNYQGTLSVPDFEKVHLVLCYFNMGWRDRVLDLGNGPMPVGDIIKEFGLEPFLPLFDRKVKGSFQKGDLVRWGSESWEYVGRMIGRRAVTPLAVLRLDDWEVFIETLDGKSVGFVSESEVEPVQDDAMRPPTSPEGAAENENK